MVGNDNHALRALYHGANRRNHKRAAIAETVLGDAANSNDGNVRCDAVQHSFANRAKLYSETGIEISAGQCNLGLPAFPKNLGNQDRIGDDLDGAIVEASCYFDDCRAAPQNDGLPIFDQFCSSFPDAHFFFVTTHRELPEVERLLASVGEHSPTGTSPDIPAAFQVNQTPATRRSGCIEPLAQIFQIDKVLPR